jgi:PKD repeat protein
MKNAQIRVNHMKQISAIALVMFILSLLVTAVSANVISIENGQVNAIGDKATLSMVLDEAPDGVSGYSLIVTVSDPSVATITAVGFPGWARMQENSTLPASSCTMKTSDLNELVQTGSTSVLLGNVTLQGLKAGSTTLVITLKRMNNDPDYRMYPTLQPGTFTVNVAAAPHAEFTSDVQAGTAPLTVQFTDKSTGTAPLTYSWDFNNDGIEDSTARNPSYTYTTAGTFPVKMTVTNPAGSDVEIKTSYITVNAAPVAPVADFSASPVSGNAPLTVQFTDKSTGTAPLTYSWDFNNDGIGDSTSQNPSYIYTAAGTYTVKLTVTNTAGSDDEIKTSYITTKVVPVTPVADFSASPVSGTAPLTVHFTDKSIGTGPLTYIWDFNNDYQLESTLQNPDYTYTQPGTYTVNLVVTGPGGYDYVIKSALITVTAAPVAPHAEFTSDVQAGTAPLTVQFTDKSTGTAPLTYSWDFNNDGIEDSTSQNPSYIYTTAGTFPVKMTVTNTAGSDDETKTNYITVNAAPVAPVAGFTAVPTFLSVQFTDKSTGTPPLTYAWDFGDGSTSFEPSPLHAFATAGSYTVRLTVTNSAGSNEEIQTVAVNAAPVADFSASPVSGVAPLMVQFTDKSMGTAPLTYSWDFNNDGIEDSTSQNPSFIYSKKGVQTVTLKVTDPQGNSDSEVKTAYINVDDTTVVPAPEFPTVAFPIMVINGIAFLAYVLRSRKEN